jgi:hypothetical protein
MIAALHASEDRGAAWRCGGDPPTRRTEGRQRMSQFRIAATCAVAGLCWLAGARAGGAFDINGAWATDADACRKVFVKSGDTVRFAKNADLHGSGFVIAGNRIRGKIANCAIKVRKDDGQTVNLAATCSTDVAVQTVQFTLKILGDDSMSRMFPGIPELETPYFRCRL